MPLSTINNPLPFAVTMGEPAGIGPEIILKAWQARKTDGLPPYFAVGSQAIFEETRRKLALDIPLRRIAGPEEAAAVYPDALPLLDPGQTGNFDFGKPRAETASLVLGAIDKAVELVLADRAAGVITAPIQKSVLYDAGFDCPGHTEYLAQLCQKHGWRDAIAVMMLVSDHLRVVPLTIHIALAKVSGAITPALIRNTCDSMHLSLQRDFGISHPRIAVAGLNPHAGEAGAMGDEEARLIGPALAQLRRDGRDILGPLPADTMFHAQARRTYDAALCMYHDQALIPIKTLDFDGGVNVTIGLPLVRTSPDHGTALDIAGQNKARPLSLIQAIKQAERIYRNRQEWARTHV